MQLKIAEGQLPSNREKTRLVSYTTASDLSHFTVPTTGSTQHQFQEFKKQKLFKKVYLQGKLT
jgi:hypothetical protein